MHVSKNWCDRERVKQLGILRQSKQGLVLLGTWQSVQEKIFSPFGNDSAWMCKLLVTLRFLASRVMPQHFLSIGLAWRPLGHHLTDNGSSTWTMQCYIILYWKKVMPTLHGYIIIRSVPELTIKHPVSQRSYRKYYQYLHLQISVL
jgi:hypothetical protein